jgi:TetR/AcrR family transcriptional regulator, regulator of autoinduction and epiphytic fitness
MVDTAEPPAPDALSSADGRVRRGARNRQAIVEAFLRLVDGGELRATGAQVAEAAGVSVRSLWTHFADMEALYDAAARALWQRYLDTHATVPADGPLAERLVAWCDQRAVELEELAPYAATASLREPFSRALRASRARFIDALRGDVEAVFATELAVLPDPEARRDALVALSSYPCWSVWRHDLGLSVGAARTALEAATRAVLGGALAED